MLKYVACLLASLIGCEVRSKEPAISLDAAILKNDWLLDCAGNAERYAGSFDTWWRLSEFHEGVQKRFKLVAPNEPVPSKDEIGRRVNELRSRHRTHVVGGKIVREFRDSAEIKRLFKEMDDAQRQADEALAKAEGRILWPDTEAPDKSHPYWEFNNNANINGVQYRKQEVSPGKWQWVEDAEAMKLMRDRQQRKRDLFSALTARVLTDTEMDEVIRHGDDLNVEPMVPYYAEEKLRELNEALLQQLRLRHAENTDADK